MSNIGNDLSQPSYSTRILNIVDHLSTFSEQIRLWAEAGDRQETLALVIEAQEYAEGLVDTLGEFRQTLDAQTPGAN